MSKRWAPWWMYVVPILAVGYLRQVVIPHGSIPDLVEVLLALGIAGAMFVAITAVYRATHRPRP